MKGQIILPEFFLTRFTDNYKILFTMLSERYGFTIHYTNEPEIFDDTDVVITHAVPHYNRMEFNPEPLLKLPLNVKLISWLRDLPCYLNKKCEDRFEKVLSRSDVILTFADEYFQKKYSKHSYKTQYFPQFIAPKERYASLPFNETPLKQCFLSGTLNPLYPIRSIIVGLQKLYAVHDKNLIDTIVYLSSPNLIDVPKHDYVKDKYAGLLNQYFCCITDGSVYRMALAKHVEICAAGSLLLCDTTKDLEKMGYEPYQHYIPIEMADVFEVLQECLNNPDKYRDIRQRGRELVLTRHTVNNRLTVFDEILKNN